MISHQFASLERGYMRFTVAVLTMTGMMAFGALTARGTVAAQQPKSQWDGVYTEDQAKRGDGLYAQYCASCHGPDLAGGEMAPGLTGGEFSSNWNDLSLGEMFERIRISMPQNAPGSLSRQQNADILAFVFDKSNLHARAGVLSGSAALPT